MSYSHSMDELRQRRMMYEMRADADNVLRGFALGLLLGGMMWTMGVLLLVRIL